MSPKTNSTLSKQPVKSKYCNNSVKQPFNPTINNNNSPNGPSNPNSTTKSHETRDLKLDQKLDTALKQIEELKLLKDGLSDQLIEKEKQIQAQEEIIRSLRELLAEKQTRSGNSNQTPVEFVTKCHLIGDSHVRMLQGMLTEIDLRADSTFKPGAEFAGVADISPEVAGVKSDDDSVVVFCGVQ